MANDYWLLFGRVSVTRRLPVYPSDPNPIYPIGINSEHNNEIITYVDGSEQRISDIAERRVFINLQYSHLNPVQRNTIYNFYNKMNGAKSSFYWVNPTNSEVHVVRFFNDNTDYNLFLYNLYNLNQVNLIEVYWEA